MSGCSIGSASTTTFKSTRQNNSELALSVKMPLAAKKSKNALKIGDNVILRLGFNVYENPGPTSPLYDSWASKHVVVALDGAAYGLATVAALILAGANLI